MNKHRTLFSHLFRGSVGVGLTAALGAGFVGGLVTALAVNLASPAAVSAAQARGSGQGGVTALVGARIWDGTGAAAIPDGLMLVRDGRVTYVGSRGDVPVPDGATVVNLNGRTIIPGLINTHGHVGGTLGLGGGQYNRSNLIRQLRLYAE